MRMLLVALLMFLPTAAIAQSKPIKFDCLFKSHFDGKKRSYNTSEEFKFSVVVTGGKAMVVGTFATEAILITNRDDGFSIVEKTQSGNVNVTAIQADGTAVHSRHSSLMKNQMLPSQWYGRCDLRG